MRSIFRKIISVCTLGILSILLCAFSSCSGNNGGGQETPSGTSAHTYLPTGSQVITPAVKTADFAGTEAPAKLSPTADDIDHVISPSPFQNDPSETAAGPRVTPARDPNEIFIDETPGPETPAVVITDAPTASAQTPGEPPAAPTMQPVTGDYYGLTGKTYSAYSYLNSAEDLWRIDNIISTCTSEEMDKTEKIRMIHEWMVRNLAYDSSQRSRHVNQVFASGRATYQGYAEMFTVFMGEIDVPCLLISGTVRSENRCWNAVNIDGEWYFVDVAMDDPLVGGHSDYPDGSNLRYTFFLVTEADIAADHSPSSELPAPCGTSGKYHDDAVSKARDELLGKLSGMVGSGEVENGFIINGPDEIENTFSEICGAVKTAAENGTAPFRFTVYVISGTTGSVNELSADLLKRLSDYATEAYRQKVNCTMRSQEQELFATMTCEIFLA